jgi:hypothetical protein
MNRRVALALVMVALLASPAVAGLTVYAPGSPVTPLAPKIFGVPGVTVSFPLYMVGTGLTYYCDTQIQFNPNALQIANLGTDVTPGSLDSNWAVWAFTPGGPGIVNIGSYGDESLVNPSGTVANILFQVLPNAPPGPWTIGLADYDQTGFTYVGGSISAALPGDANLDGTVNGADLNTVLSDYNRAGMDWRQGDFNGDGTVNGADLNTVLSNYNQTAGLAAAGAAVPEPSVLVLLGVGAVRLLACRGWRRRYCSGRAAFFAQFSTS